MFYEFWTWLRNGNTLIKIKKNCFWADWFCILIKGTIFTGAWRGGRVYTGGRGETGQYKESDACQM